MHQVVTPQARVDGWTGRSTLGPEETVVGDGTGTPAAGEVDLALGHQAAGKRAPQAAQAVVASPTGLPHSGQWEWFVSLRVDF